MAARCSLAVRDSLSTSICCLQSEFWLLRVSSFVCRANSSDSFFDNSCFSWSIYRCTSTANHIHSVMFCYHGRCDTKKTFFFFFFRTVSYWVQLLHYFHEGFFSPLIKNAFGTDSPAFNIYYTSSLFMIDEKRSKNRITKLWLVCAWSTNMRSSMSQSDSKLRRESLERAANTHTPWHNYRFQVGVVVSWQRSCNYWHAAARNTSYTCRHWAWADRNTNWSENQSRFNKIWPVQYSFNIMYIAAVCWHHDNKVIRKVQYFIKPQHALANVACFGIPDTELQQRSVSQIVANRTLCWWH